MIYIFNDDKKKKFELGEYYMPIIPMYIFIYLNESKKEEESDKERERESKYNISFIF